MTLAIHVYTNEYLFPAYKFEIESGTTKILALRPLTADAKHHLI